MSFPEIALRRGVDASVAIRVPHEGAGLLRVPGAPLVPAETGEGHADGSAIRPGTCMLWCISPMHSLPHTYY